MLIALALLMHSLAHMANGVVKHRSVLTPSKCQVGNSQHNKRALFGLVLKEMKNSLIIMQ